MPRPVRRSKLRLSIGSLYYRWRRYAEWYFGHTIFAKTIDPAPLPHQVFGHRTPLIRELKKVELWLQRNKIVNLHIAAKRVHGVILYPGETFSFWKLIGNPTRKKGYVKGMVLFYGGFQPGIGGGLCQLSNLIYWMTLHTPLTVTERHRHSYDVFPDANRTQPFGSGATCAYNYLDLRIYNPTEHPYQLNVHITSDFLVGEWRTTAQPVHRYQVYETDHRITQEYWGGYVRHNRLRRKIFAADDEMIADELIAENHALMMYQPLLEAGSEKR